jgi:hypothetical protein
VVPGSRIIGTGECFGEDKLNRDFSEVIFVYFSCIWGLQKHQCATNDLWPGDLIYLLMDLDRHFP